MWLKVILLLIFGSYTHSTLDGEFNKDILDTFYEYIFQNSTYFIYHNSTALMPSTNHPWVLMDLFVTPLLPGVPYKFATFVVRIVRLFLPQTPRPFVSILQQFVENACCHKPFANLTFTLGFTTNFQTSGQFGWMMG